MKTIGSGYLLENRSTRFFVCDITDWPVASLGRLQILIHSDNIFNNEINQIIKKN